jgi:hypothetical protein
MRSRWTAPTVPVSAARAHEEAFGDLGDIGAHWYPMSNAIAPGFSGTMAIEPVGGDLVVVLTSNVDFDTGGLVREIISDWAAEDA